MGLNGNKAMVTAALAGRTYRPTRRAILQPTLNAVATLIDLARSARRSVPLAPHGVYLLAFLLSRARRMAADEVIPLVATIGCCGGELAMKRRLSVAASV